MISIKRRLESGINLSTERCHVRFVAAKNKVQQHVCERGLKSVQTDLAFEKSILNAVRKRKVQTYPQLRPSALAENVRKEASLRADLKVDPQNKKVNLNILLRLMSNKLNQCRAWITRTGGCTSFRAGGKAKVLRHRWQGRTSQVLGKYQILSRISNQGMITDSWRVATFAEVRRVKLYLPYTGNLVWRLSVRTKATMGSWPSNCNFLLPVNPLCEWLDMDPVQWYISSQGKLITLIKKKKKKVT